MIKEGIRDNPLSLFRSYLEQREQMIQINGQEGESGVVKMCVVQGGVLSPTLFNIFVNDMFSLELNGTIQMYADDTVNYVCACAEKIASFNYV
jgi:retron-type reverse transcriptase